ncbi:hypothetical protein OHQ88_34375 (plasmid) [Micromonospora zamorensis]|uniref:hypothetical protein n=1 Tax=Micromonospora zamorensis TaxID=709883 RepID=UPI002E1A42FD
MLFHYLQIGADAVLAAAPTPAPSVEVPDVSPVAPEGLSDFGSLFLGWMKWVLMIGGVAGLFASGIMMAVGRRNRSSLAADGAAGIPWVLGGLTLGAIGSTIVGAVLL